MPPTFEKKLSFTMSINDCCRELHYVIILISLFRVWRKSIKSIAKQPAKSFKSATFGIDSNCKPRRLNAFCYFLVMPQTSFCVFSKGSLLWCLNWEILNNKIPLDSKLWQITQPAIAIHQKLSDSTITRVRTHVKLNVGTRLEIEASTFKIDK